MPVSADVLATTQSELMPSDILGFVQRCPLYSEIEKRGKVNTERGPTIQWPIPYGASAQAIAITTGDETAPTDRAKRINKYEVQLGRIFAAITIPGYDMDVNDGKRGALKLYDMYPKAFLESLPIAMERFLHTGVSGNTDLISTSDLGYFMGTLNGIYSSGGLTGLANGILDFVAPASQSDSVYGVAKSLSQYHYNQYQESNNSGELREKLKLGLREAARFAKNKKGPQRLELDPDSFSRFQAQKESHVRIQVANEKMEGDDPFSDVLGGARVEENHFIVLTDFSGDAAEGVGYGFDFDFIRWSWIRKPEMTKFEKGRIANQDMYVANFTMHGGWYFEKLTSQVAFAGTART